MTAKKPVHPPGSPERIADDERDRINDARFRSAVVCACVGAAVLYFVALATR